MAMAGFARRLIDLRRQYPILRRGRFLTGHNSSETDVKDVTWINAAGEEMQLTDWQDATLRCFGMLMDGRAQATGVRRATTDTTLLMILNANHQPTPFCLPRCVGGRHWSPLIDTTTAQPLDDLAFAVGETYLVADCSLLVFALRP
jgi:glycogen operon protein